MQVTPATTNPDVGLVDEPSVPAPPPARPGRVDEQRREALHPALDTDVVDDDAALSEELLHVTVGQAVAQVPAERDRDHIGREAKPGKPERSGTNDREQRKDIIPD
jgi:hypothetical protein